MGCSRVKLTVITSGGSHLVIFEVSEEAMVEDSSLMHSSMRVLLARLGHSTAS